MNTKVAVGKISKLYGETGECIVALYDTFPQDFDLEEPFLVSIDSLTVPLFISKFMRRGQSNAIVAFDDIDNSLRASMLIGKELLKEPLDDTDDLSEDQSGMYLDDMVGYKALFVGMKGVEGEVVGFIENQANPLFEISIGDKEVLVPAAEELIESFSKRRRRVTFDLPEGLLDL